MSTRRFERAILFARQHRANPLVKETLQRLVAYLQKRSIATYFDGETEPHIALDLPTLPLQEMDNKRDIMIVVGGDGSLLSAARLAVQVDVPVIGVSRGRLGFLTDITPEKLEAEFDAVFAGDYHEERRFLLQVKIQDKKQAAFQGLALNDVVLSRGNETHLIEFDVFVNQQFVSHYRSDGLILSTPTGSTAYALSAGGPIMHPQLDAIVIVPMFSHSLSSRPLVVDGNSEIELCVGTSNENALQLSCDGQESMTVHAGQRIVVQKSQQQLRLLHPREYNYFDTLRMKLGWGSKPQG